MRPERHIVVAGLPRALGESFVTRFAGISPVLSWLPIDNREAPYTADYADELYGRLALKLRRGAPHDRESLLNDANVILLYIDKNDSSHWTLFQKFRIEALVIPLALYNFGQLPLKTSNQRNRAVNSLVKAGRRALERASGLLSVIGEEVTNRRNRTCLLLPPANFGRRFDKVLDYIRDASIDGLEPKEFRAGVKQIGNALPKFRKGGRTYFKGRSGLVFRSPATGGHQHGFAPTWDDPDHTASCVLRGRLRFGAPYDPRFHYDCDTPPGKRYHLFNCHGHTPVRNRGSHVNIAPNDNVR